jgi:hypothetical protein
MPRTLPPLYDAPPDGAKELREATLGPQHIGMLGPRFAVMGTKVRAITPFDGVGRAPAPSGSAGIPRDRLFAISFDQDPHFAFLGKTGGGKSNTTRVFTMNLIDIANRFYGDTEPIDVVEPVESGDYSWAEGHLRQVRTKDGITRCLEAHCELIKDRRAEMAAYIDPATGRRGVSLYSKLPGNKGPKWLFLEEIAAIIGKACLFRRGDRGETVKYWFDMLTELCQRGRAADVHGVFIAQLGTLSAWGGDPDGNGIRSSVNVRIGFDRNPENLKVGLESSSPATLRILEAMEKRRPGRVAYTNCDNESLGEARLAQIMFVDEDDAYRWVQRYPTRTFEQFD